MNFCLCICKENSRHIHKYQADSISWISRFIDIRILFCYRSFVLFHAYMQVDIMYALKVAESRCLWNPKLGMRTAIVHPSRNKLFSQRSFRVCIFKNFLFLDSRYSILDPRFSHLETRMSRHSRRENRVSRIKSRLSTYIWPVLYFVSLKSQCFSPRILKFAGNKIIFFPRDQSLRVYYIKITHPRDFTVIHT